MLDNVKAGVINFIIKKGIEQANNKLDIRTLRRKYKIFDDRTLALYIDGVDGVDWVVLSKSISNPTAVAVISENDFIGIVKKQISFDDAYWWGSLEIKGEFEIRDFIIFRDVMSSFSDVVKVDV
jgi:hypothetical protein